MYGSLADRQRTLEKFCVSVGLNHLSVRYEHHLLIGRETILEIAGVQSSWLKYQDMRIIMFKQQAWNTWPS